MSKLQHHLCRWLAALMVFAALAPAVSKLLHARMVQTQTQTAAVQCGQHMQHHDPAHCVSHQSAPAGHDHQAHCPFCLLFQHTPVVPDSGAASSLPLVIATAPISSLVAVIAAEDHARRWLLRRKQGPPPLE